MAESEAFHGIFGMGNNVENRRGGAARDSGREEEDRGGVLLGWQNPRAGFLQCAKLMEQERR